jgi:hypothetical protein
MRKLERRERKTRKNKQEKNDIITRKRREKREGREEYLYKWNIPRCQLVKRHAQTINISFFGPYRIFRESFWCCPPV